MLLNLPVGVKGDIWSMLRFSSSWPFRFLFLGPWSERVEAVVYEMVNAHSARFSSGIERDRFREVAIVANRGCEYRGWLSRGKLTEGNFPERARLTEKACN